MANENTAFEWVNIHIEAAKIVGKLYKPKGTPERIIVINPATAVPQQYYTSFASWLAETQNALVLTYDYRDFGLSQRKDSPMRCSKISMSDWGTIDQNRVLSYVFNQFDGLPVWVVGHSLGGLFFRWHKDRARVERFITVATGPADTRDHPTSYKPLVLWFWFVIGPLLTKIFGFLPGKLTGLGADLPANVFWQWRRWCNAPDFYLNDINTLLSKPETETSISNFTAVALADDVMVPPHNTRKLKNLYQDVEIDYRILNPKQYGVAQAGHYRIFSKKCAALWPAIIT